jgi:hypothetical protein
MNWVKKLWGGLVRRTSTSPKLVVIKDDVTPVEVEDDRSIGEIFYSICREAKVGHHELVKGGIVEAFESWYDGASNEQSVRDSIEEFRNEHGGSIAAKLSRV